MFPDPRLTKKTKPVTVFGPELKRLLAAMHETMLEEGGIGLAANQVGLEFRMFVMLDRDENPLSLVNPSIVWSSKKPAAIREGCLSAPKTFVVLNRPSIVKVSYQDEEGNPQSALFDDIQAVCAQHEIEHLDGKSFMQHKALTKQKRLELTKKWGLK